MRALLSCRQSTTSSYIVSGEYWYITLHTEFNFSGEPDPPSVNPIIGYLNISETSDYRDLMQFRIFTESTMLNYLPPIAQENSDQLLSCHDTEPPSFNSHNPGIEWRYRWYRVSVSDPESPLKYATLTGRIQPSILSLFNQVQAHLLSTLLLSLMFPNLTLHAYSIQKTKYDKPPVIVNIWSQSKHASKLYIPTLHYPSMIHVCPFLSYCVPPRMLWDSTCQHTWCDILQILNL